MKLRSAPIFVLVIMTALALATPVGAAEGAQESVVGDQVVTTWGMGTYGLSGSEQENFSPVDISDTLPPGATITDASNTAGLGCVAASGRLLCAGPGAKELAGTGRGYSQDFLPAATGRALEGRTVTRVSVGETHVCVIASGAAFCWGYNDQGQLGVGRTTAGEPFPIPVDTTGVLAGRRLTDIAVGQNSTCAVADGRAYCWGNDGYGQLGRGGPPLQPWDEDYSRRSARPVAVDTSGVLQGRTVDEVGVGGQYACALAEGVVACWGSGSRIGDGTMYDVIGKPAPVRIGETGVLAGKVITDLSVSQAVACVVADGKPYCWGTNANSSLGAGLNESVYEPVAVISDGALAGRTVTQVTTGPNFACALADGEVFCWGNNLGGAVGDGGPSRSVPEPVAVDRSGPLGGLPVRAIYAGTTAARVFAVSGGAEPPTDIPAVLTGAGRGPNAPVGSFDGGLLFGTTYQLEGWALDRDAPADVVAVHVWDFLPSGGARSSLATVGPSRVDVAAVFPGVGSQHGFWTNLHLAEPGRHRVCAFAIDAPGGTAGNTLLGCRDVDVAGVSGSVDRVVNVAPDRLDIAGWAADPDSIARRSQVRLEVDGPAGVQTVAAVWARDYRYDVLRALGWSGTHSGWSTSVPAQGVGRHDVCAFAIDVSAPVRDEALGCRTVEVRNPFGVLDSFSLAHAAPDAWVSVQGWVIDPNLPGQRAGVDIDIRKPDGTQRRSRGIMNGVPRPDVEAVFPGLGTTNGYNLTFQAEQTGRYTVCVSATSPAGGYGRVDFGCRDLDVG